MDKKNRETIIYPSEIHKFAYCPRQYFFHLYVGEEIPLRRRVRMLIGTIYHILKGIIYKIKGYQVEETIEARIGNVIIRGRPDSYRIRPDGTVEIIERKSGKGPKRGAWLSDALQVTAYAVMLARNGRATVHVEYRTGRRTSELDSEKIGMLIKIIDDIILVKKYGIVPYANKSPARCSKCPFKQLCDELDAHLPAEDPYEPGKIIKEISNIDLSFK